MRDIEDAFRDDAGLRRLSRASVSEIGDLLQADYERLRADCQDFVTRNLSEHDIAHLERIRPGHNREPVLAAWGFHLGRWSC